MAQQIKRDQVAAIAADLSKHYGTDFDDGRFLSLQATVVEGDHLESRSPWLLIWEECPDPEWTSFTNEALKEICARNAPGFFAEAINSYAVAFHPI